ncbi:MAG: hypothetical protein KKH83_02860 [Candidatus Margulisbacteria bacterium]|nr:hypothetical protein [Candidatus Margulisiibacteriota bacterium]
MKKSILVLLGVFLVSVFAGSISLADTATQVGNKVVVRMAVLADPDVEKTRLMALSPVITYKGGLISFKPDMDFVGGPGSQIGGHLRLVVVKDGVSYVFAEPFLLIRNHNPSMLIFDPVADADLDPNLNNALKSVITVNSKIRVGILLAGSTSDSTRLDNGRLYASGPKAFGGPGSATVSDNIDLGTDYQSFLAIGTFTFDNAELPAGKNKIVW